MRDPVWRCATGVAEAFASLGFALGQLHGDVADGVGVDGLQQRALTEQRAQLAAAGFSSIHFQRTA